MAQARGAHYGSFQSNTCFGTPFFSCKSSKIRAIICVLGHKKTGKKSKGVVDGIKMAEKELGLGKNQVLFGLWGWSTFGGWL